MECHILLLRIKEWNDHIVFIFMCPNIVLTYSCSYYRLDVAYFTWLHQLRQLPASPLVSTRCGLQRSENRRFREDLLVSYSSVMTFTLLLPVMLKSLRMPGVGECHFGVRLPEDSEVLQMRRRFAWFREEDSIESSLIYTSR